jgi:hypothetical protein
MKIALGLALLTMPFAILALESPTCRERFTTRICKTKAIPPHFDPEECAESPEPTRALLEVFDRFPLGLQTTACQLDGIYIIEEGLPEGATAAAKRSKTHRDSMQILFNERRFAEALSLSTYLEKKENQLFGVPRSSPLTPLRLDVSHPDHTSWLGYALTHELGHVIQMSRQLEVSWELLPWTEPAQQRHALVRIGPHELLTGRFLNLEDAEALYTDLLTGNSFTLYGASSPEEDFAETFTFSVFDAKAQFEYKVTLPNGKHFDLVEHFRAEKNRFKHDFLQAELDFLKDQP